VIDVIQLTQELIRFPTITPAEAGCLDHIEHLLRYYHFTCHRIKFGNVDNLYARWGSRQPNFCFAGHVDVVPIGEESSWICSPFAAEVIDGELYGRGVVDMKGAIAAFITAAIATIKTGNAKGSISLLLTCDEEGPALEGTRKVLQWLQQHDEKITACLVGEPTNPQQVGEMVKVGRRGSLNGTITVFGKSGHAAYPELAHNPIPPLLAFLQKLSVLELDQGIEHFSPSRLEMTSIDVGNPASNVIPEKATAKFNIRFNPSHTGHSLQDLLSDIAEECLPLSYDLAIRMGGEPFYCPDRELQDLVADSVAKVCGRLPEFSTSGGTSDARFIKDYCSVIEFGLINETAHQANERIALDQLHTLEKIYTEILSKFFRIRM
jgi:succinyl-diaminopimelate desuccinylase